MLESLFANYGCGFESHCSHFKMAFKLSLNFLSAIFCKSNSGEMFLFLNHGFKIKKISSGCLKKDDSCLAVNALIECLKVALSHSEKDLFIIFNERPLKVMKNAFYLILKALFVLNIFRFLT